MIDANAFMRGYMIGCAAYLGFFVLALSLAQCDKTRNVVLVQVPSEISDTGVCAEGE